jgi:hypothetical protein
MLLYPRRASFTVYISLIFTFLNSTRCRPSRRREGSRSELPSPAYGCGLGLRPSHGCDRGETSTAEHCRACGTTSTQRGPSLTYANSAMAGFGKLRTISKRHSALTLSWKHILPNRQGSFLILRKRVVRPIMILSNAWT